MSKNARRDEAIQRWNDEVLNKSDEFDPEPSYVWEGVAKAFFMGCGFSMEEAEELLDEVEY